MPAIQLVPLLLSRVLSLLSFSYIFIFDFLAVVLEAVSQSDSDLGREEEEIPFRKLA